MKHQNQWKSARILTILVGLCIMVVMFLSSYQTTAIVHAGQPGPKATAHPNTKYFTSITKTLANGKSLDEYIINGPPTPPAGVQRAAVALPKPNKQMATNSLNVPAFNWVFGCSAVSASMVAGYYDRNGFPNIYTGPTDGGVMPMDNSSWPTWSDGVDTYPNLPLAASHNGVDGRTIKGSIDDYWVQYGSSALDPYITGSWTQHTWGDAIGDYMKTSQSAYGNTDGSTQFYNYTSSADLLTCSDMVTFGIDMQDGTYGRKLFYEARGYAVTDCYNQNTDNNISGGFTFAQFKAQIDAGQPVLLNLAGHSIVGVGYDDSTNTVYIHDTWDYLTHSMVWGDGYAGMELLSVSIVNIQVAGNISGTVTDSASAPIVGATIAASGGYTTTTDATGHYTLHSLPAGAYSMTASKYGYVSQTAPGVGVTPPGGTTQNFTLAVAATSIISGVVTDAATGWPLYARLDIPGYLGSPVFTNPVTGAYSVSLTDDSYTVTVSAMSGGYITDVQPLTVSGNATQNFGLVVDLIFCTAPGYTATPASFSEAFETWPLTGWTIADNIVGGLTWDTNAYYGDDNYTGGAGLAATVDSNNIGFVDYDTELISPVIPTASLTNGTVLTYLANYHQFNLETLDLDIQVDGGAWTNLLSWSGNHGVRYNTPGEGVEVDLAPAIAGSTNFQLRWHYYTLESGPWDWYAQVDEVKIGAGCAPIPSTGLVIGSVFDASTGLPLLNASVKDAALHSALLIDASADPATPAQIYVIVEAAGAQSLTASFPKYANKTQSPIVVSGGTVRQDFNLVAGKFSTNSTSLEFDVSLAAPTASKTLTLNNIGGASANYEIFAIPGTLAGYAAPTGPFAARTRHFVGPKNLKNTGISKNIFASTPRNVPAISGAGNVTNSWATGLTYAWGIGFNTDATDLWLGNIGASGGDDLDYRFTTAGVNTGDTISTTPWVSYYGGDMTYNPFTNMLWQVNIGGDSCIYELDPATKTSTGNKICPAFNTDQRGLAFDPLTNTYYAGSWNDGIINHFTPDGVIIDSAAVNLSTSGLAFNPRTGHLFAMTNHASSLGLFDVYVLDTRNAYAIVGAFNLKSGAVNAFSDYGQAGLEMDCNGNLWAVDQDAQEVYVATSGETGVCNWQTSWLSVTPATGTVANGSHAALTINVNATGLTVGAHTAYLRVVGDTPYNDLIVPVTLNVVSVKTVASAAAQDGWVLESSETGNKGGTINATATTCNLGDNATKKQYRCIMSFSTGAALPDTAVITGVTLKVKKQAILGGGNPVSMFQGFMVDIKNGFFGTAALQAADFQTVANKTYGPFTPAPVGGWYSINLTGAKAYVNKLSTGSGLTQIRLRFKLDDNNNTVANYLSLYSGNAPAVSQPQLVITYYIP